ncbi:MAG: hypothetical protein ACK5N0_07990 [Synechococcaceae cyanobacterium]
MAMLFRFLPVLASSVLLLGLGLPAAAATPSSRPARTTPPLPPTTLKTNDAARMALARHLTAIGARVYTVYWCPHCQMQKDMFGAAAAARLNVIECAADAPNNRKEICKAKKIRGVPTWEINGRMETGVQTLEQLAKLSGYPGSQVF